MNSILDFIIELMKPEIGQITRLRFYRWRGGAQASPTKI